MKVDNTDLQWGIMANMLDFDFGQTYHQDEMSDSLRSKNMFKVKARAT